MYVILNEYSRNTILSLKKKGGEGDILRPLLTQPLLWVNKSYE